MMTLAATILVRLLTLSPCQYTELMLATLFDPRFSS